MKQQMAACLESWSRELESRANRVRQLIGDKHWLSDGHQKEYILREFIQRQFANRVEIARGFICPPDAENPLSGEIDLLIFDPTLHPPWFYEGGLAIIPPTAVVGQLHVKTTLKRGELADVFASTVRAALSIHPYRDLASLWAGAFFFDNVTKITPQFQQLVKTVVTHEYRKSRISPELFASSIPSCIASLGGYVTFFSSSDTRSAYKEIRVRVFDAKGIASAIMLADMFEHFQSKAPRQPSALTQLIANLAIPIVLDFRVPLR